MRTYVSEVKWRRGEGNIESKGKTMREYVAEKGVQVSMVVHRQGYIGNPAW